MLNYISHPYSQEETIEAEVNLFSQGGRCFSKEGAGGGIREAAGCAAEQSQEQEGKETEIINEPEITSSLSLSKLQDRHKDYSHQPGELIISWLF